MLMNTHFTIVVPTLNRLPTLRWALETCVNQEYDNYTIVIADNNCADGTREYLLNKNFKNVRVLRANKHLSMTENWDRIARLLCEEDTYIHYLGDDDGLLPFSLRVASEIISHTNEKLISWKKVEYSWPDLAIEEFRNSIIVPLSATIKSINSREFLANCHNFDESYSSGPGVYTSFVHSSIFKSIYEADGEHIFRSASADVYSAYVIASTVPNFMKCQFALSINGGSGYSNGVSYVNNPESDQAKILKKYSPVHRDIIHAPSVCVAEADALLCARDVHRNWLSDYEFNWRALLDRLASDMRRIPPDDPKRSAIGALVAKIKKDRGLTLSPDELAYTETAVDRQGPVFGFNIHRLSLTADMEPLGVKNVLDAARFVDAVMPLRTLRWEIEAKATEVQSPTAEPATTPVAPSLLRRAVRRARRYVVGAES